MTTTSAWLNSDYGAGLSLARYGIESLVSGFLESLGP